MRRHLKVRRRNELQQVAERERLLGVARPPPRQVRRLWSIRPAGERWRVQWIRRRGGAAQ